MSIIDEAMERVHIELYNIDEGYTNRPEAAARIRSAIAFAVRKCAEIADAHLCNSGPQDACGPVIADEILRAAGLEEREKP